MEIALLILSIALVLWVWFIGCSVHEHLDDRFNAIERHLTGGKTLEEMEDDK